MEQLQEPSYESPAGSPVEPAEPVVTYPPKYPKEDRSANMWVRSLISLALFLMLGYYFFHSFNVLLLITAVVIIHELGHFIAMKLFRYKDLGIFFIPLLGAYVSGTKREVSQKESAIILLAGPLPGIVLGIVFYMLWQQNSDLSVTGISFYTVSMMFLFINLINLLPIYPLDGGQLLNRVFFDEESWLGRGYVLASAALLAWFAIFRIGMPYGIPLLIFPGMMLLRLFGDSKLNLVEKKIEAAGINLDTSYEELPDKDYWEMRNILVAEHPSFRDVTPAPPFEYSPREEKVMTTIQSLLHRHFIQDVSLAGKFVILLLCAAAFAAPWLLDMDLGFLRRFGI